MDSVKAVGGLIGTVAIAGWVAFSISAPRNVDNAMNDPMASLEGSSISQEIERSRLEVRQEQCAQYRELAGEAWERALDSGNIDRDAAKIDELDRKVERFCD